MLGTRVVHNWGSSWHGPGWKARTLLSTLEASGCPAETHPATDVQVHLKRECGPSTWLTDKRACHKAGEPEVSPQTIHVR